MWKFCSGSEKIRNASGQQGENEQQWKKSEQEYKQQILGENIQHFLHKMVNV